MNETKKCWTRACWQQPTLVIENAVGDMRAVCADCADVIDWPTSETTLTEFAALNAPVVDERPYRATRIDS